MSNPVIKIATLIGFAIVGLVVSLFIGGLVGGWMEDIFFGVPNDNVGPANGMMVAFVLYIFGVFEGFALWTARRDEQGRR